MNDIGANRLHRLAVIKTHSTRYRMLIWLTISTGDLTSVKVFYASNHRDPERVVLMFDETFAWDVPLFDVHRHEFLPSVKALELTSWFGERFPIWCSNGGIVQCVS